MKTTRANKPQVLSALRAYAVIAAGFAAVVIPGVFWRDQVLNLVEGVSGGSAAGMAAGGWLIVVAPFLVGFVGWLLGDRIGRPTRIALITLAALLAIVALWFLPGCGRHYCGPVEGPRAFQTGTIFGALTGIPAGIGVAATLKNPNRRLAALLVIPWALLMLGLALVLDTM